MIGRQPWSCRAAPAGSRRARRSPNARGSKWFAAIVASVVLIAGALRDGQAYGQGSSSSVAPRGVRHRLAVAVSFDPDARTSSRRATLTALIRISDHARDSNFFGIVPATFSEVPVNQQIAEQAVWQDRRCHQDRGIPKISLMAVNGTIAAEGDWGETRISARPRHVGQKVPLDEIVLRQDFVMRDEEGGRSVALSAVTSQTKIRIDVKLYIDACEESPSARGKSGSNAPR